MKRSSRMSDRCVAFLKTVSLLAVAVSFPLCAVSQQMSTNNSYATMLQNNAMRQSNLTQQMINLGGKPTSGSGAPVCLPPFDLQRGPAGLVPPALQGDPRYQEYLRCRYGNVPITPAMANAPALPVAPAPGGGATMPSGAAQTTVASTAPLLAQHLSIAATDFIPVQLGHPAIEQQIANMPISADQRQALITAINATFNFVAQKYRANNLAVSVCVAYEAAMSTLKNTSMGPSQMREYILKVNDAIAQGPQFVRMSDAEKQNFADTWIFETSVLSLLRASAQRGDVQAQQQAVQLAQVVVQRLDAM